MADKPETNTISQKIRKLLSLADGNQNEHERDSAMQLAMELLSKHNLDLTTITDNANDVCVTEFAAFLKLDPWIRAVLRAVCKLYYTEFFMRPVYRGYYNDRKEWHPTFVGTADNINVTIEVAAWLISSIRLESNWLFTQQYERRSFRLGAAHKVYERACQLIDEEKQNSAHSSSNSLMILRNELEKANRKHMGQKDFGTFQSRGTYYDGDAYGLGESYGNTVNLGRSAKPKALTMR